jgi:hypothetical protein
MARVITKDIAACSGCPHRDHTGAFTPGGAKPCCRHEETCRTKGYDCFKRVIKNVNKIPKWCPLRKAPVCLLVCNDLEQSTKLVSCTLSTVKETLGKLKRTIETRYTIPLSSTFVWSSETLNDNTIFGNIHKGRSSWGVTLTLIGLTGSCLSLKSIR